MVIPTFCRKTLYIIFGKCKTDTGHELFSLVKRLQMSARDLHSGACGTRKRAGRSSIRLCNNTQGDGVVLSRMGRPHGPAAGARAACWLRSHLGA